MNKAWKVVLSAGALLLASSPSKADELGFAWFDSFDFSFGGQLEVEVTLDIKNLHDDVELLQITCQSYGHLREHYGRGVYIMYFTEDESPSGFDHIGDIRVRYPQIDIELVDKNALPASRNVKVNVLADNEVDDWAEVRCTLELGNAMPRLAYEGELIGPIQCDADRELRRIGERYPWGCVRTGTDANDAEFTYLRP